MPLISTLVDSFTTDQLATLWPGSYGTFSVTGGRARVVCDTGYNAIRSGAAYTVAGSSIHAQMIPPAPAGATQAFLEMRVDAGVDGTDIVASIDTVTNTVTCSSRVGYFDPAATVMTYDPLGHRYLRFRETGGTFYWERSADRTNWHIMRSTATPAWLSSTTIASFLIQAHRDAGTNNFVEADDVNVAAPAAQFPVTTLPASVHIAPGANPADPAGWQWTDITNSVRTKNGISIEEGRPDEAGHVDPSKCTLVLDNRSSDYGPRAPRGQYYGRLRRNTPLQVRVVRGADNFNRPAQTGWGTSSSGNTWTYTSTSPWSTNGTQGVVTIAVVNTASYALLGGAESVDARLLYSSSLSAVPTGGAWISGAAVRFTDVNNTFRVHTEFDPDGTIKLKIARRLAGVTAELVGSTPTGITYSAGTKIWSLVEANGPDIRLRVWKDGTPEPTTWNISARDGSLQGAGIGMFQWRIATNAVTASIDDLSITGLLFTGTVQEWPSRWDQSANNATTTVVASGILRRLQQGDSPLRSPIYRQLSSYSPAGYWPLEDGSDTTLAASAIPNGPTAGGFDISYAADDTLPGASAVVKLNSQGAYIQSRVRNGKNTPDGYAGMLYFRLETLPGADRQMFTLTGTGRVARWNIITGPTGFTFSGVDSDGATVVAPTSNTYLVNPLKWTALQLETQEVGANTNWTALWHQVGSTTFYFANGSYSGTADQLTAWQVVAPTANTSVAHVWLGDNDLPFVANSFALVSNGYSGESAIDRIQRLCTEQNVSVGVGAGTSSPQGVQREGRFVDLLRVVEDADMGVLYERGAGFVYRPRGDRFNQPVAMALDFAQGHIAEPPEPTDDDQSIRNDWTVSRDKGGSSRYSDETHIAAYGRYDDSATINIATDDELPDQAAWRVHLGTADEMRWPLITLDLARNPSLISPWMSTVVGSRITLVNPPAQVAGDDIDLIIEGCSQKLTPYGWKVELNCSPARPWNSGDVDSTARADTSQSAVNTAINATAVSLSVKTLSGPRWVDSTNYPAEFPFDINVGGERMTVTAVSGTTSPQTFTVTRGVNGVAVAHPVNDDVHLWAPVYVAF